MNTMLRPLLLTSSLLLVALIGSSCSLQGTDGVKSFVRQNPETDAPGKLLGPKIPINFTLNGSIGMVQGEEGSGWHGKLNWRQTQNDFSMRILGPFGDEQAELLSDAGVLKLKTPDGQLASGNRLAEWQKQAFGTTVPLQALPYWLHAVPYPDMPQPSIKKANGKLSQLQQDGWQVNYSDWGKFDGRDMPKRITMTKAQVRIKLVVNEYNRG